ncbi:MAG: hypothetical protein JSR58_05540 [Verrucomicrobia bacterium]|nr:hypothetical protein [Verrucomicrobiota bacterium]
MERIRAESYHIFSSRPTTEEVNNTLPEYVKKVRDYRSGDEDIPTSSGSDWFRRARETTSPAWQLLLSMSEFHEQIKNSSPLYAFWEFNHTRLDEQSIAHSSILATGVSGDKGGIVNLLNILLIGTTYGNTWYGGLFPSTQGGGCAINNGPFYIILDEKQMAQARRHPTSDKDRNLKIDAIDFKFHILYVVPEQAHVDFLDKALNRAVEVKIFDKSEKDRIFEKIVTFEQFKERRDNLIKEYYS